MNLRSDLDIISEWIAPRARVLDLGCGDGALLRYLQDSAGVTGYGLEIDADYVTESIKAGVNVIQMDLDAGLEDFETGSFDYVVMTQALQVVHHPDRLLDEMLRIGEEGIVTFPNFGHWKSRVQLGLLGRMPLSRALPAQWYDTANIHLCTVRDFEALCAELDIRITSRTMTDHRHRTSPWMQGLPNLMGEIALYSLRRGRRPS